MEKQIIMVEAHWDDVRDRELRFRGHTWALTGEIDIRRSGELLGLTATQEDDVRRPRATLFFELRDPPASLNPGDLGGNFERIERVDDAQVLVVKNDPRVYRYELQRLEYE